jgi:hypothetical protein
VNVGKGATVLRPQRVSSYETDRVAAASTEGKLLVFDVAELPALPRGKGVQTIKLHRTPIAPEKVVGIAVVPHDGTLIVQAGKRYTNLKGKDLDEYLGKRAQRGLKLPRGFQTVSSSGRGAIGRDGCRITSIESHEGGRCGRCGLGGRPLKSTQSTPSTKSTKACLCPHPTHPYYTVPHTSHAGTAQKRHALAGGGEATPAEDD